MTVDQRLRSAVDDARDRVRHLDVPQLSPRRPSWIVAVATGAAVLIVGALVWLLGLAANDEPPVVDSTPTTVTTPSSLPTGLASVEALPEETGSWSVETSLGTWTWTRVEIDPMFFADGEFQATRPVDLADDRFHVVDGSGTWWVSDDGSSWTEEELPEIFSSAPFLGGLWWPQVVGDQLWVRIGPDENGEEIYYRLLDGAWSRVELSLPPVPQIPGTTWSSQLFDKMSRDGISVALVQAYRTIDWSPVYGRDDLASDWDEVAGTLKLYAGYELVDTLRATVIEDPSAVEFYDVETGDLVLHVDLGSAEVTPKQLLRGVKWSLMVDDGSGFRVIDPPWAGLHIDQATVVAGSDGLVAIAMDSGAWGSTLDPGPFVWRSSDGLVWESLGSGGLPSNLQQLTPIYGDPTRLFISDVDGLWTSTDGSEWQSVELGEFGSYGGEVTRTSFGWVMSMARPEPSGSEFAQTWLSADGLTWEPVTLAPQMTSADTYGWGGYSVDDAVFSMTGRFLTIGRLDQ